MFNAAGTPPPAPLCFASIRGQNIEAMSGPFELQGMFTKESLPGLLQYIGMMQASGELVLRSGRDQAVVTFKSGRLVDALFRDKHGEEAVYHSLVMENGNFHFRAGDVDAKRTSINNTVDSLLLNAAYWQDTHIPEADRVPEDVVLHLLAPSIASDFSFQRLHWQILAQVDGHRTAGAVAAALKLSYGEMEPNLRALVKLGLVQFEGTNKPVDPAFFNELTPILVNLLGPIGKIKVLDVADAMGIKPEELDVGEVRHFIEAMSREIKPSVQQDFLLRVEPLLKRYGR
jgi:hypothetical protein